jgi:hypothetical protein
MCKRINQSSIKKISQKLPQKSPKTGETKKGTDDLEI